MKEKVSVITGASGEIGQNLIARFEKIKNKKIIALDLNPPNKELNFYRFIRGSILDLEIINELADNYIIEEIFHLAAVLSTKAEKNPKLATEVNINGTLHLLNLALLQNMNHGIITKFFFPSSIAVYNTDKNKAVDENSCCNPKTTYGQHKLFCENLGTAFDLYGNRLGYGGGYYDKTFSFLKKSKYSITSICIAFDDQKSEKLVIDQYDEKIDYILTEKKIYIAK